MTGYVLRRVLQLVPMVLLLSALVFGLLQLAPGDPAAYFLPDTVSDPTLRARITAHLGLDQPPLVQYLTWVRNAARGDLGYAFSYGQPTAQVIAERLVPTLQLQAMAIAFSVVVALPVGIVAALRSGTVTDRAVTTASLFGLSMPDFWFGLMLVMVCSLHLGWLPPFGMGEGPLWSRLDHFVLPVVVLGTATVPWFARLLRTSVLEVLDADHVRTARAKGLAERLVLRRHVVKVALLPVVTMLGLTLTRLVGGTVVVETVFAWPGLGRLAYDSVVRSDYPLILGLTVLTGAFVMVVNLVVDLVYARLDPRIRYG